MPKTVVFTDRAPAAIGPYSQAIRAGEFLFCSGQLALDPKTGELVQGGIEEQTKQALENLSAVLTAAGAKWDDVVRTTIFLVDLGDFAVVNRIYGEAIGLQLTPPARVTVQVAALPKGAAVEIDAIAHLGASK